MAKKPVKKASRQYLKVTRTLAKRVLKVVDAGLSVGVGDPVPGRMCVEAAVNYAMGLPHGDEPPCVAEPVRTLKINLNDHEGWADDQSRAKGLRALAIAQLGSNTLSDVEFIHRLLPLARHLAKMQNQPMGPLGLARFKDQIAGVDRENNRGDDGENLGGEIDLAIDYFMYLVPSNEKGLKYVANAVTKILVKMGSPGAEFLDLVEG
jgi:hypothetical protein